MSNSNAKKSKQLGMSHGTASSRLRKEILWQYVKRAGDNFCYRCGEEILTHPELSVEHKTPWLDSDDPIGLFFSLDNISFSHLSCNVAASRCPHKIYDSPAEQKSAANLRYRARKSNDYLVQKRKEKYQRTGN